MAEVGITRRSLLGALALLPWLAGARSRGSQARVLVVGGGFAGATAARHLKLADPSLEVILLEPRKRFHTCPFSNQVIVGLRDLGSIGHGYETLVRGLKINHLRAWVEDIDPVARQVRLADGRRLSYDRLVLTPGIALRWNAVQGYDQAASARIPHAWQAGAQTELLRRQLAAMADGGLFLLSVPDNPYRCPPGPYERASLVAHYLQRHKPRSKVLIFDAKDSFSKQALFQEGWKARYGDLIEWVGRAGDGRVERVDVERLEVQTEFGSRQRAAVINLIPPQQAGLIAERAGLTDASGWVPVNPLTFQARADRHIYVAGDACIAAPMPKSAYCANAQARVAVAALLADLAGVAPAEPHWRNTCYSALAPGAAVSIAADYRVADGVLVEQPGSLRLSPLGAAPALRAQEAAEAEAWYSAICADAWGARA